MVDNTETRKKFDLQAGILNSQGREKGGWKSLLPLSTENPESGSKSRKTAKHRYRAGRTSDIKGREIRERFSRRDWHSRLIHACLIFACSLKRLAGHHSAFFFLPLSSEVSLRAENCPPPLFQRISRRSSVGRKEIFAFAFLFRIRNGTFDRFRNVLTFDTF